MRGDRRCRVARKPKSITFHVHGQPVPQPRARVSSRGGIARAYVPAKHPVHGYRQAIEMAARAAGLTAAADPVDVVVLAQFERPKSHMTKRGVKATAPGLPRPDVDNVAKAVLDALQPLLGDDTIVGRLTVAKMFAEAGMTTVTVQPMPCPGAEAPHNWNQKVLRRKSPACSSFKAAAFFD